MVYGNKLMKWRENQGWSLAKASELSEVSKTLIHDIEHDRANPSTKTLEKLCKAYGKTLKDLFGGK